MKFESKIPSDPRRKPPLFRSVGMIASLLTLAALAPLNAQVGFSYSRVNGLKVGSNNKASKVTSLQFGPDNKLYYLQSNGTVWFCTVNRIAKDNYEAVGLTAIDLVKNMPNYNDDGTYNPTPINGQNYRQATGLLVTGTAANPVIYVTSSDPREGAGSGATDLNLDTNSGVVSRLTKNGSGVWEKVDLVRGLPRSEENHATNGLTLDPTGTKLLVAQGGSTNAGSPSNNFAFACEQALAACVLSIDLAALDAMPILTDGQGQKYLYNLPTVNDPSPTRADSGGPAGYTDLNDPFGGDDGLNQAKLVEGGPVQVFASGFRNPYDVMVAKTPGHVGKIYSFDNASNNGWGGYPKNEGLATVTNEWVSGEPGTVNNRDALHLISQGYYGGHPNPIRANPTGAGWLHFDDSGAGLVFAASPTADWPPVPASMADVRQSDFRLPGAGDGSLITNSASTCGLAEYTANNFGGAMVGNIITAQFSSGAVQRIVMNADGTQALSSSIILSASGFGSPLDIAIPGVGAAPALTGTIFVAHYLSSDPGITVLEPTDFESGGAPCTGDNSYALDEDNDGYSNADELLNASDPCSPAVRPPDADGDFLSDLIDTDDDNDGIADSQDVFPIDRLNGANVGVPATYDFFNTTNGFFAIGLTGVMLDPGTDYTQRMDLDELIAGGTAGLYTDPSIGAGTPLGEANTQMNAFQFGVNVDESTGPFRVIGGLGGLLFNGTPTAQQSQGIFIGNGDQDNYVKVAVNANGGPGAIEVVHEENGVVLANNLYPQAGLFSGTVKLSFVVNPVAGTVQPGYAIDSGAFINVGPALTVGGKIRDVLHGSSGMAVGLLASTNGAGTPSFNATWDYFYLQPITSTASASLMINSNTGSILSSSTNTGGSFQLTNTSTGGQKIVSAVIDISTAVLPDVVFDPNHTAGDNDGNGYTPEPYSAGVTPAGTFEAFHNGVNSIEGYTSLRITSDPNSNFGPGTTLSFSADVDPTSVKGTTGPGPNQSSSVNGLELSGTTVTVTFDDGTVRKIRTGGHSVAGFTQSNKTSYAVLEDGKPSTPSVSVPGKSSPYVANTQPIVRVSGTPGATVKLWILHTSLDQDAVIPPYDIDPFEANNVTSFDLKTDVVGAAGYVDFKDANQVTLTSTTGGINYLYAVALDSNGKRSSMSNILTIDYDPNATDDALIRVNAGGPAFTDSLGHTWAADNGYTSGSTQGYPNAIAGTVDDTLYQTFRYDDTPSTPLDYSFQVQNGNYMVKLHFAETWSGITAAGQRVFDVLLEGQTVLHNYDVYAVAGANTARVETFQTPVTDGNLTIGLRKITQNPFISAIEVYYLGGGSGPDTDPPTTPGTLAASNLKSGSLTLTWAASTDDTAVTGYRVFRNSVDLGTTTSLSFPQTGLSPQTGYTYEVQAFDAAGNLSERASLPVTTPADTEAPTTPGNFKGMAGNQTATLSWLASTDDTAVTGYRVYRDGNLVNTTTTLGFTEGGLTNGSNYSYQVIAFDASGKTSPAATTIVRPRAIVGAVYRIDCGLASGTTTDTLGNVWSADGFNNGVGLTDNSSIQIAGTTDDVIYRSRRYDGPTGAELKYTLPVANGDYELRLHFAETTSAFASPVGQRVFDVKVQDQLAIDNLDIVATAGYATALMIPIPVSVTNGSATVEFLHNAGLNNPTISGIELYQLEPPPPDTLAPTQPGSFTVTGTTAGSVSLAWTSSSDNVGVTGYRISRNGGAPVTVTGLSYNDTGLAPGTLYNYSVVAVDAAANASTAATTQGTTGPDVTAPTTPSSLVITSGNGTAALSWQASTDDVGVTGYRIYKDNVLLETVASLSYTATGLANETTYNFKVRAIDGFLNESAAAQGNVTPRALGPVAYRIDCGQLGSGYSFTDPSGNVWAKDDYYNVANTSVTTVTSTITGTTNPEIYKSFHSKVRTSSTPLKYEFPVTNGTYEVRLHFAETSSSGTSAGYRQFNVLVEGSMALQNLDVFAEAGGQYKALVKVLPAVVTDGKVTLDFQNATPTAIQNPFISGIEIFPVLSGASGDSQAPTQPGSLQASSVTANSLTLGWTASTDNTGVTGYRVYRNSVLLDTVTTLSFNNTGLTPGTLYHYEVRAIDQAANASTPATLDVTTTAPDSQPPSTPGNLAATPALSQIGLTWAASTDNIGVTGYKVYRGGSFLTTVAAGTLSFNDTGLASGTHYNYEVIAVDAIGNASTPASIGASTLTDTVVPSAPGTLGGTPTYTTVALTWGAATDNVGVSGYRIYRGALLVNTVTTLNYTDQDLIPGTPYHYEVRAIDAAGNASTPVTFDTTTVVDNQVPSTPLGFDATPGDQSVALTWAPSTDNVGLAGYEIRRNNTVIATVTVPGYTDTGLTNGVLYTYQMRALDLAGNASGTVTDSAKPRALGANMYRVDAGYTGSAYQDSTGKTWVSDASYAVFGSVATSANAIAGTVDDVIYQTERYDSNPTGANLAYDFVLPSGDYEVRLHFAETYAGITGPGQRVFDVKAEGSTVIDHLDIFSRVGLNNALVVTFPVTVTDGLLDLDFIHLGIQNPKVCGIEIFAVQPANTPQTFDQWLAANGLAGQTNADSDGGGLSNLAEYELQMNPNDRNDDFEWALKVNKPSLETAGTIILPKLKPIGNYYLHRSDNPATLNQVGNRILTITKAQIQGMTQAQRDNYTTPASGAPGKNAFYRLIFEPVP